MREKTSRGTAKMQGPCSCPFKIRRVHSKNRPGPLCSLGGFAVIIGSGVRVALLCLCLFRGNDIYCFMALMCFTAHLSNFPNCSQGVLDKRPTCLRSAPPAAVTQTRWELCNFASGRYSAYKPFGKKPGFRDNCPPRSSLICYWVHSAYLWPSPRQFKASPFCYLPHQ